ncbi:MAG TPA: HAD-IA family hydrolase [Paracoccaceae bacterium]|nr:HAD-IA family hydrolase [Paracoccaceae bacterium]
MRGAIFDLDGTLADTAGDLLAAANEVLAPRGLPLLTVADRPVAGRGGREMIRRSLAIAGRPDDTPEALALIDGMYPDLLDAYETRIAHETTLFEGAEAAVDALAAGGWRIGICTNKPERLALLLIDALGVRERFSAILGADTLHVRKPDPEHFFETARRIGADPARSVMIGDTLTDLTTARRAGVPCVLTGFGFAAEPLAELAPDAIVAHFDELPPVLERLCPAEATAARAAT